MNREFLDLYNRELQLLYEQAHEFAEEYPGIAERLGGLLTDRMDPMVAGLLEGAAFLAARVQLKLKHEFPEFTNNLFEQLVPNYLAPNPSALLAKVNPAFADPALREGHRIPAGSYLDATYRERDRQIACRYRLTSDITLWPFEITGAEYFTTPAPLHGLGLSAGPDVLGRPAAVARPPHGGAAARTRCRMRKAASSRCPGLPAAALTELPIFLTGSASRLGRPLRTVVCRLHRRTISGCWTNSAILLSCRRRELPGADRF